MNHTKILIVAVLVLGCLGPLAARADLAMTILTETYHATGYVERADWGSSPGEFDWYPGDYRSYDLTTSTPPASGALSIPVDTSFPPGIGDADPVISVHSLATRYQEGSTAFFKVEAAGSRLGDYSDAPWAARDTSARLDVEFRLSGPDDHLHADVAMDYGRSYGTLRGGGQSWKLYGLGEVSDFTWNPADPIPIDTTQIYTLSMDFLPYWSRSLGGAATVGFSDISTVFRVPSPVPLPGAVLLGLVGLGCAGQRLRRGVH